MPPNEIQEDHLGVPFRLTKTNALFLKHYLGDGEDPEFGPFTLGITIPNGSPYIQFRDQEVAFVLQTRDFIEGVTDFLKSQPAAPTPSPSTPHKKNHDLSD
jgi:hypothetical protein